MNEIIPVVNCMDFGCVKRRFDAIHTLQTPWVHIDISDGKFAPVTTWNNPLELLTILASFGMNALNVEVHLMVENIETYLKQWSATKVKRFIVHVEALDRLDPEERQHVLLPYPSEYVVGLSILPQTSPEALIPYILPLSYGSGTASTHFVQTLAVAPGFSSQPFQRSVLEKIRFLHEKMKDLTIEVDGGVTPSVVAEAKSAGANLFVSSSYLWGSKEPLVALETLRSA
ncbi:MAG: hypothetical protein AAB631_01730 [Patescibacteria group bacterium]